MGIFHVILAICVKFYKVADTITWFRSLTYGSYLDNMLNVMVFPERQIIY